MNYSWETAQLVSGKREITVLVFITVYGHSVRQLFDCGVGVVTVVITTCGFIQMLVIEHSTSDIDERNGVGCPLFFDPHFLPQIPLIPLIPLFLLFHLYSISIPSLHLYSS